VKLVEAARQALGTKNDLLVDTGWFVERTPKEAIQWSALSNSMSRSWWKNY